MKPSPQPLMLFCDHLADQGELLSMSKCYVTCVLVPAHTGALTFFRRIFWDTTHV